MAMAMSMREAEMVTPRRGRWCTQAKQAPPPAWGCDGERVDGAGISSMKDHFSKSKNAFCSTSPSRSAGSSGRIGPSSVSHQQADQRYRRQVKACRRTRWRAGVAVRVINRGKLTSLMEWRLSKEDADLAGKPWGHPHHQESRTRDAPPHVVSVQVTDIGVMADPREVSSALPTRRPPTPDTPAPMSSLLHMYREGQVQVGWTISLWRIRR